MADISATSWSETDASNNQAPPLGWPPVTMNPQQVEPTAQAGMGATKRFWDRINGTVTTAGSSGAYTYTPVNTSYPVAYVQGETYRAKIHQVAAGSDTLNINSLGALNIYKMGGGGATRILAGDLLVGQMAVFTYDSALNSGAGGFLIPTASSASAVRNYIAGLALSNSGGSPNTIVDVAIGLATDSTNVATIYSTATLHPDITVSGVGGLDTGAVAATTWYAVLLINGTAGTSAIFTKQTAGAAVSPTMPAGYTYYRYVGSVLTDASSHILAFKQIGNWIYWSALVTDVSVPSVTVNNVIYTLSVPICGIRVQPLIILFGGNSTGSTMNLSVNSPDVPIIAIGQNAQLTMAPSVLVNTCEPFVTTDTSGRIRLDSRTLTANLSAVIYTRGWIDPHLASIT